MKSLTLISSKLVFLWLRLYHMEMLTYVTSDIDAQIQRNKERIADGVLPWQFEIRLREYENLKQIRECVDLILETVLLGLFIDCCVSY